MEGLVISFVEVPISSSSWKKKEPMEGLVISFVEVPISSSSWKKKEKETMKGLVIYF